MTGIEEASCPFAGSSVSVAVVFDRDSGSTYRIVMSGYDFKDAQRRIAEAARTQAGFLDLVGLELVELPIEIRNLTALRSLALQNNQLTDVTALGNLTALKTLGLSENRLTDVTALGNLTALP